MSESIPSVLTPEQWKQAEEDRPRLRVEGELAILPRWSALTPQQMIALNNHLLEHDDPRKITREWVSTIRSVAIGLSGGASNQLGTTENFQRRHRESLQLHTIADALASYLPPEEPR